MSSFEAGPPGAPGGAGGAPAPRDDGTDQLDEDQPRSSADNVIPMEQLQNGLRTAKSLWLVGWNGVKDTIKAVDESEQMSRFKEAAAPVVERAATGLSEVGQHVGSATQKGVQWTGERFEDAKPSLIDAKDKALSAFGDLHRRVTGTPGGSNAGSSTNSPSAAGGSGTAGAAGTGTDNNA